MKVHVVGNGGREHCLRVVLGRTSTIVQQPDLADLIVVGPEQPLVAGYADEWRAKGKLVYGPGQDGARLEGSKAFMKDFVARAGVPTAKHGSFTDAEQAIAFMKTLPPPYVVKTDGLAAGKGVLVTESFEEACDDVR
jgi:phosphoribosylamine--glycine ligase